MNLDRYLDHEWAQHCKVEDDEQEMINLWGERLALSCGCKSCEAWKHFDETGEVVKP